MPKKLTRQEAMAEVIDSLCPAGPFLALDDALALAAACEAVAALYEQGGSLHGSGLGFTVKPASLKGAFLKAAEAAKTKRASVGPR